MKYKEEQLREASNKYGIQYVSENTLIIFSLF